MPKRNKTLLALLVSFIMVNCDSNAVYDVYKTYPNQWHKDSIASFKFTAPDTTEHYNLYLNLRNNNDYQFNNLFVIVDISYPNGKTIKDTLEYKMAKPNGELLGTGFSDIKENKLWYKGYDDNFTFSENGEYEVHIQHAMRKNGEAEGLAVLNGITEVGFRIERLEN